MRTHKINIEGWSDEQYEQALVEILNMCVQNKNSEAGAAATELDWGDVSKNIKEKFGSKSGMSKWRNVFKMWHKNSDLQYLKFKGIKI